LATERVERRLAAILAADVAGYSRLMGADEEGTHARLRAHFRQLVDPKIKEHGGRTVKNTGDGLLAEFSSAVNAVRCADRGATGDDRPNSITRSCSTGLPCAKARGAPGGIAAASGLTTRSGCCAARLKPRS